jgi:hypothetical protein
MINLKIGLDNIFSASLKINTELIVLRIAIVDQIIGKNVGAGCQSIYHINIKYVVYKSK